MKNKKTGDNVGGYLVPSLVVPHSIDYEVKKLKIKNFMPIKKAKNKTATEPKQTKTAQTKITNLTKDCIRQQKVNEAFDDAIREGKKNAKQKIFWGDFALYAPLILITLWVFVYIAGFIYGVSIAIMVLVVGSLLGKLMRWSANLSVEGEMQLRKINEIAENKTKITKVLADDLINNSKKEK